jgi:hypothetical protein
VCDFVWNELTTPELRKLHRRSSGRREIHRLSPLGRDDNFPDYDSDGRQRIFESEDAVCDFVWERLNHPDPATDPEPFVMPTPEQLAEQRRRGFESLGMSDPHGLNDGEPTV